MKEYFLRTERLGFATWKPEDFPEAFELWGDPEVTKYIKSGGFQADEVRQRLKKEMDNFLINGVQYWPIYLLETNQHIGCCGLRPFKPEEQMLEIGIHLKQKYWSYGYAKEACAAVIAYAFHTLHIQVLVAGHHPKNQASAQLLKKLGFVYSHDEFYPPTGLMHPSYRITRADYLGVKL